MHKVGRLRSSWLIGPYTLQLQEDVVDQQLFFHVAADKLMSDVAQTVTTSLDFAHVVKDLALCKDIVVALDFTCIDARPAHIREARTYVSAAHFHYAGPR